MPMKFRVWYSTESMADYVIDHTKLQGRCIKKCIVASDASSSSAFHTIPDHIKKILYLDSPDIIVEYIASGKFEPIFTIEVSQEAGTGHNAFQRFARLAASVENSVPAIYIYPDGAIISRQNCEDRWDKINPLIFRALTKVIEIYKIPALLFYYPSDLEFYPNPKDSPNKKSKGLLNDSRTKYLGCPESSHSEMKSMFSVIDTIVTQVENTSIESINSLLSKRVISERIKFLSQEFEILRNGRSESDMSPISAVIEVPTEKLVKFIETSVSGKRCVGELINSREKTVIYQVNSKFRGDPYPGALSALDYLLCREGKTFENRDKNLVLAWGLISETSETIEFSESKAKIKDFFDAVKSCEAKNLLTKKYKDLDPGEIPRYYMQVRYGSTYSKVKHIRVFSYFADAILFEDGCLWRDA